MGKAQYKLGTFVQTEHPDTGETSSGQISHVITSADGYAYRLADQEDEYPEAHVAKAFKEIAPRQPRSSKKTAAKAVPAKKAAPPAKAAKKAKTKAKPAETDESSGEDEEMPM
jgi:hypothetical protein